MVHVLSRQLLKGLTTCTIHCEVTNDDGAKEMAVIYLTVFLFVIMTRRKGKKGGEQAVASEIKERKYRPQPRTRLSQESFHHSARLSEVFSLMRRALVEEDSCFQTFQVNPRTTFGQGQISYRLKA